MKCDLSTDLGRGLLLKNPVMSASGTFGYGEEAAEYFDIARLGAVVVKGISLAPRGGNPPPRVCETPAGMLNAIGLQNVGVEAFVADKLPFLRGAGATVVVNILGDTVDEYVRLAGRLSREPGVAALEVNISCPNVKQGGVLFGTRPELAAELVRELRQACDLHLMVKLSPNASDIPAMARAVEQAGADSVSLINTITGMAVDVRTRRPCLANVTGGLSGPAIRPVAVRMAWEAARAVKIPVVGMGGILDADDALQFLMVGARAVQVGTATFRDPAAALGVVEGLSAWLEEQGVAKVGEVVGSLRGTSST
jgi:dihydroorotate dehydrogenase (NAD+) catalytic subunit